MQLVGGDAVSSGVRARAGQAVLVLSPTPWHTGSRSDAPPWGPLARGQHVGTLRLRQERPSRLVPLNTASLILAFRKLAANAGTADFLGLVDKVWLKGNENEDSSRKCAGDRQGCEVTLVAKMDSAHLADCSGLALGHLEAQLFFKKLLIIVKYT